MESKSEKFSKLTEKQSQAIAQIDTNTEKRLEAIEGLTKDLADFLTQVISVDLKTLEYTKLAIRKITDDIARLREQFPNPSPNNPDYQLQLRVVEHDAIKELATLYNEEIGKTYEFLRFIPFNANIIALEIKDFMREKYKPLYEAYAESDISTSLQKATGKELFQVATNILKDRVALLTPLPSTLGTHEAYLDVGELTPNSKRTDFYDANVVKMTKSPVPSLVAGIGLFFATSFVRKDVMGQTLPLALAQEGLHESRMMEVFEFSGPLPQNAIKNVEVQEPAPFIYTNTDFNAKRESKYQNSANKSDVMPTKIEKIYFVAPANSDLSKLESNSHQIYFFSKERAEEFREQAKLHPHWYDPQKGWNTKGWKEKMQPHEKLVAQLEEKFLKDRATRSYLVHEKVKVGVTQAQQNESQFLQTLITVLLNVPKGEAREHITKIIFEDTLARLNEKPGSDVEKKETQLWENPDVIKLHQAIDMLSEKSKQKKFQNVEELYNEYQGELKSEVKLAL